MKLTAHIVLVLLLPGLVIDPVLANADLQFSLSPTLERAAVEEVRGDLYLRQALAPGDVAANFGESTFSKSREIHVIEATPLSLNRFSEDDFNTYLTRIRARALARMRQLGLTEVQLAKKCGLAQTTIAAILTGQNEGLLCSWLALAEGLEVAPEALLDPGPTLATDSVSAPHSVTVSQVAATIQRMVRHSPAFRNGEWSRRTGLTEKVIRNTIHRLKMSIDIQVRTLYVQIIWGLGADLSEVFKTASEPLGAQRGVRYTESEERLLKALTGEDLTSVAMRLKLAFEMLKERDERLAEVLQLYVVEDRTLGQVRQVLNLGGTERARQLKDQAFVFLALVMSKDLGPLLDQPLMVFEPFGLGNRYRLNQIKTLEQLLAADQDGRLDQLYKPLIARNIRAGLASIRALVNKAPFPPLAAAKQPADEPRSGTGGAA